MNQEFYEVLQVSPDATDEQIEESYQALKEKYSRDRWLPGEEGREAVRALDKLNEAYREIKTLRAEEGKSAGDVLGEVAELLRDGKLAEAQAKLDDCNERSAEWHYYQSAVFHRKNWLSDSKKQLEIAMQMDASNEKYREAYRKLNEQMESEKKKAEPPESPTDESMQMGAGDNCASLCYSCMCGTCLYNLCCGCR